MKCGKDGWLRGNRREKQCSSEMTCLKSTVLCKREGKSKALRHHQRGKGHLVRQIGQKVFRGPAQDLPVPEQIQQIPPPFTCLISPLLLPSPRTILYIFPIALFPSSHLNPEYMRTSCKKVCAPQPTA